MATEFRKTGISVVGDAPWGTHFCHFYETKQDLLDTLVPYFKAGLESKEFCLWVVSAPELITIEEARTALAQAVPDLDRHFSDENIEILNGHEWYFEQDALNLERAKHNLDAKLKQALARGYEGLRVSADTFWLAEKDWKDFFAYEKQLNDWITNQSMTVMCTYPLAKSGAAEVLDVVQAHQFAIARRQGEWEVIERPEPIQARAEIKRLNEELQRVPDRMPERPAMVRHGVAVLSVIAAVVILLLMDTNLQAAAHISLFLCAVIFSTCFGGIRPGLLAILLSILAFAYILPPSHSLAVEISHLPRLLLFAPLAFFVAWLIATQQSKAKSLRHARDVLYETVQELKRTNVALQAENAERKRSEDALRQSEERFAAFMDNLPGYAWMKDLQGRYVYVNEMVRGLPGYRSLGKTDAQIWPADLAAEYRANDQQVIAAKKPLHTLEHFQLEGKHRYMAGSKFPVLDKTGAIVLLGGVGVDITERIEAEEAVRRSEEHLRQVIDTIPTMAWSLQPDGAIDFVNQRWMDYTGLSLEEAIAEPTGTMHPEDLSGAMAEWGANMAAKEPFEGEIRLRRVDGEYRWFMVRTDPLRDEQGSVVKWYGVAIDIEDRKRAEEDLRRQKEILQTIFDNVPAMIGFVGPDGKIKLANREWERTLGWTLEEVLERDLDVFAELYPDPKYRQEVLNFVFESNAEWADFATRVRDGRVIDTTWANVHLADGTTIGIGRDITERKRAERESRALIDAIPQQIWSGPPDGTLDYCNQRWRSDTGLGLEELRGEGWQGMLHPDDRERVLKAWHESVLNGTPYEQEARHRGVDGTYRWYLARGVPLRDAEGIIIRWYGTNTDIEARKNVEEELRRLSGKLLRLQDEERRRIARDLHDSTGQELVALATMLGQLRSSIPSVDRKSARLLSECKTLADKCIRDVRTLSYVLHPPLLDEAGLVEALRV